MMQFIEELRRRNRTSGGFSLIKVLIAITVLGVLSGVLVFAVSDDDGGKDVAQSGVTRGGTMVVAIGSTGSTFNPAATSNGGVHTNSEVFFNGLTAWGPKNTVVSDLAEKWQITDSADGTQSALFTLRSGVKWHDFATSNKYLTAEDVDFTFRDVLLRYHSRTAASMGPALGVTTTPFSVPANAITMPDGPGGLKVQFNFLYPYAALLRQLNVTEAPIIPKHVYRTCVEAGTIQNTSGTLCPANTSAVGTGPFKWSVKDNTKIEVVRNPNYFKAGLPYLDRIVYLVTQTAENALLAARGTPGSVDVASISGSRLAEFGGKPDWETVTTPRGTGGGNCITTLSFNLWAKGTTADALRGKPANAPYDHPILKDLAVRRAIAQAFDRSTAFTSIDFGQGRLAVSPYHSGLDVHQAKALPAFDRARAAADLEAAGWILKSGDTYRKSDGRAGLPKAGTELALDNTGFDTNPQAAYSDKLVADLATIGIKVTSRKLTSANQQTALANRDYDTAWISYCHGDAPVIGVRRAYHSSQITPSPFVNVAGVRSQKASAGDGSMDDLWDRAARATGDAYRDLHNQIQDKALSELPYMWMVETAGIRGTRSACTGFNHNNTGLFVETASCSG